MAETVGQHSVAAFTSPVNGTTPIDANTVRGNDNTVRSAYVDHDADPGIHVQSSSLASRPVAGTVGRKWITVSSGRYQLWYDDGSRWNEVASDAINVDCLADANLTKGEVVKITGFNNGQNLPTVNKVTASTDTAFGVVENTVTSGNLVQIVNTGLIEDVDTNGYAVGTILYPNSSGGWTTTKPTSGNYQPAGYVLRGNTNNGVLYVEFSAPRIVERSDNTASTIVLRDASGNFSAGTITATALTASGAVSAGSVTSTGLVTFASLKGTGATTVTNILDEDNMASDSATALATQQSIKAYVDAQVATVDTLAEVLANGNTTGANNIIVTNGQKITTNTIDETTAAAGVTIDSVLLKDNAVTATTFNGTLNGAAPAGSLSGTTLASNVVSSSLTSVGTLANLTVTNPISGSVTGSSGSTTGNAATATALQTARNINGVSFNGTADITVTAAAGTLTGTTLASGVTASSLTSVGTLTSLTVSGDLTVDTSTLKVDSTNNTVGIGTATPGTTYQLTVRRDGADTGVRIGNNTTYDQFIYFNGNNDWSMGMDYSNSNAFVISNSSTLGTNDRVVLTTSGNLGLGTASPDGRLDVAQAMTNGSTGAFTTPHLALTATATTDTTGFVGMTMASSDSTNYGWSYGALRDSGGVSDLIWKYHFNSAAGTERMRLDRNGNLGLGVTPSVPLHVKAANNEIMRLQSSDTTTGGIYFTFYDSADAEKAYIGYGSGSNDDFLLVNRENAAMAFFTNATERARIDASGNLAVDTNTLYVDAANNRVGVGTATPASGYALDVNSSASKAAVFRQANSSAYGIISVVGNSQGGSLEFYNSTTALSAVVGTTTGTGDLKFYTNAFNTLAATIDSSGNLGVGTTSPSGTGTTIEVKGATGDATMKVTGNTGGNAYLQLNAGSSGNAYINSVGSGALIFGANGVASSNARITSGGNFLINTTTATARFATETGSDELVMYVAKTVATNSNIATFTQTAAGGNGGQDIGIVVNIQGQNTADRIITAKFNNSGTPQDKFYVERTGSTYNATGTYGTISDERLKQDIVDAPSQWDDLKAVRFRKYRMKTDVAADQNAPAMLGVVAQELELVSPKLVEESPVWEQRQVPVLDEDGNETGETKQENVRVGETKTVKMSVLLIKAAVALQEAMARIEALEARLEALEA